MLRHGGQPPPAHVQLIISDFCNQCCQFCAYRWDGYTSNQLFRVIQPDGTIDNNPKRMIAVAKCLEILDDCRDMGVGAIQITGGGEPTAHPQHLDVFRGVLDRGMQLALVTNGIVMRDPELLARAAWVRVSVDAGTPQTYAKIRRVPESQHRMAWANIRRLCEARAAAKSQTIVGVGFVVTKENWDEALACVRTAKDAGVDNVRISAVFQPDDERYFDDFHADAADLCREAEALSDDKFRVFNNFGSRVADLQQHAPDYTFCGYQQFATYVGADLNVYRCCNTAYNDHGLIGSLKDQRFAELWQSQQKRERFANFDARSCDRCMFNDKNRTINYLLHPAPQHVEFV